MPEAAGGKGLLFKAAINDLALERVHVVMNSWNRGAERFHRLGTQEIGMRFQGNNSEKND